MSKISFVLNNIEILADENATILSSALANNIYIPNLCDHPDLRPSGACRLCMVEVMGVGQVTACTTKVTPGMIVKTDTPKIEWARKINVQLLLANHEGNCWLCRANMHCELQRVAKYVGIEAADMINYMQPLKHLPVDTSNPFFDIDRNKCVLCGICTRTCNELQCICAITLAGRGAATQVLPFYGKLLKDSNCESCGECLVRCPTGALVEKHAVTPAYEIKSTCPYCGCGCSMYLGVRGAKVVSVRGDRKGSANRGSLCVKGRFGIGYVNSPERLTTPLLKQDNAFVPISWDQAFEILARELNKYQGDKIAVLSSAKFTNEENYVLQKFARVVLQTNNIDHCARLCHAPTVAGLAQTLGSGAMTNTIRDIGAAKCIFAIGTNTTVAHPIIALQVKRAAHQGAHLIVANPREIVLGRDAAIFMQHNSGTDVALLMGMMRVIVEEKLQDQKFIDERCENFSEFLASLQDYPLERVEQLTGVPRAVIVRAARLYATTKPATILYAMGITQHSHGTDNVIAISNLALLTGNLGQYGAGVNPLRGQNNVQGACDMGALPDVYPGYQKVIDPAARQKFAAAYGASLNPNLGLTHPEMFAAVDAGQIAAFYIAGENPILSEANAHHIEQALAKLKFLVVQDIFLTETARLAHLVLPATTFAEKNGTFTNTERRVQRVRKAIPNVGDSKPDWEIVCELARRMGAATGFNYKNTAEIMDEIASLIKIHPG